MPKPQGGVRILGIPTGGDRLIQQAIRPHPMLYYEPEFLGSLRQEAYNTYEIAKTEREVAERNRVQKKPFGLFIEEMTLQKTLTDSQVAETAAHII